MHFIIYSKCRYYTGGLLELQACLDRSIPLCPICCDAAQMPPRCCIFYHQHGTRVVICELKLAAEMLLLMEIVESESSIMAAM